MLQVDIVVHPGGWADNKRVIQRIAIWNVSELAEVSDYEYAISRPYGHTMIGEPPSGLWMANNVEDPQVACHGAIYEHKRSDGALELLTSVLNQTLRFKP